MKKCGSFRVRKEGVGGRYRAYRYYRVNKRSRQSKCTTAGITREQAIAREASLVDTMHALKRPELWVSNSTCTFCGTQQHSTSGMRGACRGNNNRFTCTHKRSTRPIKCPNRTEIQPLQPQLVNCLSGYSPCVKLIRSQEGA
ncbi:hypothetical protein DUNSADRAFT_8992 [Dunaliella salina]|uniref:Uncharacterized protein n=1 Tax=Dunaliella salina TaxID=3046 RepID=A0ABQ7GIK6_DUNSA|nr:hypothetical protein DUNSADRAFT_8992 [Dunaliella salina]|eukprot:KAF5834369.1 hypothetical protein DUNSADRAFT_8992 [Dunaliella salina]